MCGEVLNAGDNVHHDPEAFVYLSESDSPEL